MLCILFLKRAIFFHLHIVGASSYNPIHGELQIEKAKMALCIQKEIDEGRGFPDGTILFDTTKVLPDKLETYVNHCKRLRHSGIEPLNELPRIRPAAHSHMGGIRVDES